MSNKTLDVYLQDELAGHLVQDSSGKLSFSYSLPYLDHGKIPLSQSLPITDGIMTGSRVDAYFSGLLPDDDLRHRIAAILGVSARNPFAILAEIGGECAGAVSLYPQGEQPASLPAKNIQAEKLLDEHQLREIFTRLRERPLLAGEDGIRLSLAGAQNKIAVVCRENEISLPLNGQPTTHIIKPMIDSIQESVINEYFCMRLAKALNLKAPTVAILTSGGEQFYLVERYDRELRADGTIVRLHQEDFCQALSIAPERKYQREGGPSIADCQRLLQQAVRRPAAELLLFEKVIIFNYLIGNSDAHGKNYSLLYRSARPDFAPVYDLMSTAVYSQLTSKMAMKIGSTYNPEAIQLRYWHSLVAETQAARRHLEAMLIETSRAVLQEAKILRDEIVETFPDSQVVDKILAVIKTRTDTVNKLLP